MFDNKASTEGGNYYEVVTLLIDITQTHKLQAVDKRPKQYLKQFLKYVFPPLPVHSCYANRMWQILNICN